MLEVREPNVDLVLGVAIGMKQHHTDARDFDLKLLVKRIGGFDQ